MSVVRCARPAERELDEESADWLRRLSSGGRPRQEAEAELHARLVRIALAEVSRRSAGTPVTGPELTDLAHQAADDAMLAILAKLAGFRGESRFMTWAYRFVMLEVSSKLGRHYWRDPPVALDAGQWERLPDRLGIDPQQHAESAAILAEVRRVDRRRADRAPAADLHRDRGRPDTARRARGAARAPAQCHLQGGLRRQA